MAYWNDQTEQAPQQIDSGGAISLSSSVTSVYYDLAQASELTSTVAAADAQGLIPGKRGMKISYTVTAGSTNPVQGFVTGNIAVADATAWQSIYDEGYLTVVVTSDTPECTVQPVANKLGWTFVNAVDQTLKADERCMITVDLSIPAVKGTVDVSQELLTSRGITTLNPLADFTINAILEQVPRAKEKP